MAPHQDLSAAEREIPAEFFCPVTQEVMKDPVFCADGHTYERRAIEAWLQDHATSPLTNADLVDKSLTRNHALASQINRL